MGTFLVSSYSAKSPACALVVIADEWAAIFITVLDGTNYSADIAVLDDSHVFDAAPELDSWVSAKCVYKLRATGLTNAAKLALLRNSVFTILHSYPYLTFTEVMVLADAVPESTPEFLFTPFGDDWPLFWKSQAKNVEHLFNWGRNPAFDFLAADHKLLRKAARGAVFLALSHLEKQEQAKKLSPPRPTMRPPTADERMQGYIDRLDKEVAAGMYKERKS